MLVFTDGSFSHTPDIGGMGAVIISKSGEYTFGGYSNKCIDNNVAEVTAIAMALYYIKKYKVIDSMKDKTINIISDSSYALRKIISKSIGRNEFEQKCLNFIQNFLTKTSKKVFFMQIKGHQKDISDKFSYYNNMADNIAGENRKIGVEKYKKYNITKYFNNKKHR